jgi:hypothetical protein
MSLDQVAAQLRQQLDRTGQPARTQLERGLRLTLWRDGDDLILSLTRPNVLPSETEIRICMTVFSIPPGAGRERDFLKGYHIVRLRWREPAGRQNSFLEEAPPNHYTQED